jgi:hypothetical protein
MKNERNCVEINSLEDLEYADDICLLSHKYYCMQSKQNDLCRVKESWIDV